MRELSLSDKCELLDYKLIRHVTNNLGQKFEYGTFPQYGGGCHNYFNTRTELETWIKQVDEIRKIQFSNAGEISLIEFMER